MRVLETPADECVFSAIAFNGNLMSAAILDFGKDDMGCHVGQIEPWICAKRLLND
jgi:hypothetical protein